MYFYGDLERDKLSIISVHIANGELELGSQLYVHK